MARVAWPEHVVSPHIQQHSLKVPHGAKRSAKWPALARAFLLGKVCGCCGGMKRLQAHHIKPFHLFPELELVESNWVPLCEGNPSMNCHLVLGHLGNFASYNLLVVADASKWLARMLGRP